MAGVAALGAVAVGFTALAGSGGDGPATEITDGRKLTEQFEFLGFQLGQRVVHEGPPLLAYNNAKIYATKKEANRHLTLMSRTRHGPAQSGCYPERYRVNTRSREYFTPP
jgi:hypothetical protein